MFDFVKYMYLADVVGGIKFATGVGVGLLIICMCYVAIACDRFSKESVQTCKTYMRRLVIGAILCTIVCVAMPNQRTMYVMAGSAAVKELSESPISADMKDIVQDLKTIIHNYAEQK